MRLIPLALAALLAAGCAAPSASGRADAVVRVGERDFRISAPASIDAGVVDFSIRNRGPVAHEPIVVKADGSPLPLRRDGLTVDEDAVESRTAEALEPQPAGDVTRVRVRLTPGRYVLFCNMSGHYLAGMRRAAGGALGAPASLQPVRRARPAGGRRDPAHVHAVLRRHGRAHDRGDRA